jgi:hypothetical protein
MDLSNSTTVREFLALCLDPGHGITRTPATLAKIMPGPLGDAVHRFAPHLAGLREDAEALEQHAATAGQVYAEALAAWIKGEPTPVPDLAPATPDEERRERYAAALYSTLVEMARRQPWVTLSPFRRAVWYARADAAIKVADAEARETEPAADEPKPVFLTGSTWSWQCLTETGGCGYPSICRFSTETAAQRGLNDHRAQCAWTTGNVSVPARIDQGQCPQNRTGSYLSVSDPVQLGPHFYKTDEAGRWHCVYCDAGGHWGGEPPRTPQVRAYVFNSRSVNRTTKHAVDPANPARTLCPSAFVASPPMPTEQATRLTLCGGCRRALTGQPEEQD